MKKILIQWVFILSGLYTIGHVLFGFDETRFLRIITNLVEAIFFGCILLYINLKEKND